MAAANGSQPNADSIAQTVFDSLNSARQIAPFSNTTETFEIIDAYAITAKLRALRIADGYLPIGRKIGFTNRTIWEEYGIYAPIWGDMYRETVFETDPDGIGSLSLAGLCEPRIEPEIVFGLSGPITGEMNDGDIISSLDWIAHGFEIVQSIYPEWKFQISDCVACGGLHGRLIIGPRHDVSSWQTEELAAALSGFSIELSRDEALIDWGAGANVLDSPLNTLRHLAKVLEEDPFNPPLKAGETITTGTLTRAFPVAVGEIWTTRLTDLDLPGLGITFS